jgi:DNA-directed RNA polymerase subunit H (RpoH/RPB5)
MGTKRKRNKQFDRFAKVETRAVNVEGIAVGAMKNNTPVATYMRLQSEEGGKPVILTATPTIKEHKTKKSALSRISKKSPTAGAAIKKKLLPPRFK